MAGRFFEDIGYFAVRGTVSSKAAGTRVEIYWLNTGAKQWHRSGTVTTTSGGSYAFNQPVGYAAAFAFRTTLGGVPGTSGVISSNQVSVTVADSSVKQNPPVSSIDSLKNPIISGSVHPARAGVNVSVQVRGSDNTYRSVVSTKTNAKGQYATSLGYDRGKLTTMRVRSVYQATNRPTHREFSKSNSIKRVKKLNAVITKTTAAEVAKTYRRGCPVGASKLRTITMNYYGFDKRMHRGLMIVRTNLTSEITRSFQEALDAGYPMAKMKNPNDYGGNDPKQMEANNTSGFNCRKVVGNPYAQSPHSYGIAIDVNPVQNPYRDRNGKWWPENGRKYIDRSPLKAGMLGKRSALTKQLTEEDFFWGGLWSPGKDYQHFEYDK